MLGHEIERDAFLKAAIILVNIKSGDLWSVRESRTSGAGAGQRSRSLVLVKRIVVCGDENAINWLLPINIDLNGVIVVHLYRLSSDHRFSLISLARKYGNISQYVKLFFRNLRRKSGSVLYYSSVNLTWP